MVEMEGFKAQVRQGHIVLVGGSGSEVRRGRTGQHWKVNRDRNVSALEWESEEQSEEES
jgi:hypothetical protein